MTKRKDDRKKDFGPYESWNGGKNFKMGTGEPISYFTSYFASPDVCILMVK